MATFNKFDQFVGDLGLGVHNLETGTLKVMLTNSAPIASNTILANLTDLSTANGYTAGGAACGGTYSQTSGTGTLATTDVVWTASGGTIGPFRYAVLYNDTPTSPADPLIGWWDYTTNVTLQIGETFTVDFGASTLTIT